jgi:hypothetical protein
VTGAGYLPGTLNRPSLVVIHLTLVGMLLGMALILALPEPTFPRGMGYASMAALGSEKTWALVLSWSGLFGLAGLWDWQTTLSLPVYRRPEQHWEIELRWHLLMIAQMAFMHLLLGCLVFTANPAALATVLLFAPAAQGLFLLWQRVHHAV